MVDNKILPIPLRLPVGAAGTYFDPLITGEADRDQSGEEPSDDSWWDGLIELEGWESPK